MIDKISSDENILIFKTDMSQSFANAFRRAMVSEVPIMAIDTVHIYKNSSAMFDETLASRLGLLPLTTDLKGYNLTDRCTCKGDGCAKCTVKLYFKETKTGMGYANTITSKDPKIVPVYPKTPIVWLNQGHEVELEATARLGKGKEHAKYSPGMIYFKSLPKITFKDPKAFNINKLPKGLAEIKGKELKINEEMLSEYDIFEYIDELDENINIKEDKYIFVIESWGQLKAKEIAIAATDELMIKAKEFESLVKKMK